VIRIEDMRLGRKLKFRGLSDREGDINTGTINGTAYELQDNYFYVPLVVHKLNDGTEDKQMIICSENIVGVWDSE
jgi:hypothetical protein